ncbi:MAG: diguanylate cyclase [Nitrospirota bacterium]
MADMDENRTIICVDDQIDIIENYKKILIKKDDLDFLDLSREREEREGGSIYEGKSFYTKPFRILTAVNGDEAVKIVNKETMNGRKIAAGFFDMVMPDGMDGLETIKKIKEIDNEILCAIVTAYNDRPLSSLQSIFRSPDEWIYFNKPFTSGELEQTAFNLISLWNRRKKENQYLDMLKTTKEGLMLIIESTLKISKVPPPAVEQMLKGILNILLGLIKSKNGLVLICDENLKLVYVIGSGRYKDIDESHHRDLLEDALINKSISDRNIADDAYNISLPLILSDRIIGVIYIDKDPYISVNKELLELAGLQSVHMIHNSRLYNALKKTNLSLIKKNEELENTITKLIRTERLKEKIESISLTDELTGLSNRRDITKRLLEEFSRARRFNQNLSVMMIDIDNFKKFNDNHGHIMGDRVLKQVSSILLSNKRSYDVIGRYGGEEFLLIFPGVNNKDAAIIAKRIMDTIKGSTFLINKEEINITVSIGIYTFNNESDIKDINDLIKMADNAMYMAKKEGKDKAVNYNETITPINRHKQK